MLDNEPEVNGPEAAENPVPTEEPAAPPAKRTRTRRVAKAADEAAPTSETAAAAGGEAAAEEPARPVRRTRRKTVEKDETGVSGQDAAETVPEAAEAAPEAPVRRTRRRTAARTEEPVPAVEEPVTPAPVADGAAVEEEPAVAEEPAVEERKPPARRRGAAPAIPVLFMAPEPGAVVPARAEESSDEAGEPEVEAAAERPTRRRRRRGEAAPVEAEVEVEAEEVAPAEAEADEDDDEDASGRRRRRRGRRGRGRGRGPADEFDAAESEDEEPGDEGEEPAEAEAEDSDSLTRRRRRRRRRGAGADEASPDDPEHVVVKIREPKRKGGGDEVQGVSGSTRLEAKRQRRRDGREQRRTRPPILSESEFLARREAVDRVMVVRSRGDRTQIAVLEDGILVEHYVTRQSASTMVGNVYLGKVQNVLPSMEAAFVDVGRGRNAVLYAGEVNWDASGLEGRARSIEQALRSGDSVLVQVTKDPVGHKGARLTSHIALSGRHLVYVPHGNASGISRKLSDVERRRLRDVLKSLVPDGAGVIVRTAAEGASEDDLARDVKRLQAQWEDIQAKAGDGGAPALLYSEPDLVIRVVRDLFNEDFRDLVVQGSDVYDEVEAYLHHVSPDLVARVRRHTGAGDVFAEYRIDEQILKGLDRKVYLPSGGHLVFDRTEAMTVIDVNTGKYTGAGGNLEETVTRNNLEAAEEIVRQLRLRDLGGIIVIDFIDMVLESNRELVLRRLTECLGRDRTKHQVTEITSLGLVQMTRKRIGQGLLEAFSEPCEHCKGRGLIIHTEPVPEKPRGNVAERVKAVAASGARTADADDDDAEPDLVPATADEDADDDDLGEESAGGGRRRTRRGGARRRTRP
ncbi:Rne/Rng family ribonuclease [Luedemannella helvata]|uniref:S1 motif domain-containing protein n=1 Tax=Luedemannella helvata TaxID=349315 RepID=A0ABN2KIX8_9ACTN